MTTNKHNEECCPKCLDYDNDSGRMCSNPVCPCHTKPAADVSWEEEFDKARPDQTWMPDRLKFGEQESPIKYFGYRWYEHATTSIHEVTDWGHIKSFIRKQLDRAREESKHITKSGRVMYMAGRREAFGEALKTLEGELVLAHTTESGKTSRLTSAFVRIEHLRDALDALSNK